MSDELANLRITDFLARLASDAPTPGGGSVAALAGAMAAALGRMVCGLTMGRPRFAAVEAEVRALAERFERAQRLLAALVDEDAAAYGQLNGAFKLRREETDRAERIRQAAVLAAEVPLQTASMCHRLLGDLGQLAAIANPNLKWDVKVAEQVARAGLHAAATNVEANLPWTGEEAARALREQLEPLLHA